MRYLILLFLSTSALATPNWHKVQPDGFLACSTSYAAQDFCGTECQAREHDQDCEVLKLAEVDEPYREPDPEYEAELAELRENGHLKDGSTVTKAPPFLEKTRKVKRLVEDPAKRAEKDARDAAAKALERARADAKGARATRAAILKGKALTTAEQREVVEMLLREIFPD